MNTLRTLLLLTSLLSVRTERYRYGGALWPRDRTASDRDVTVIARTDIGFPRAGNITSWSVYTNGTGNITFEVWRPSTNGTKSFVFVGGNDFRFEGNGLFTFEVFTDRIQIETGDVIGLQTDDARILPYSAQDTDCHVTTLFRTTHHPPEVGLTYKFQEVSDDLCRVYSVQAEIEIFSHYTTEVEWRTSGLQSETSTPDILPEANSRQATPQDTSLPEGKSPLGDQTTSYDVTSGSKSQHEIDVMLLNGRQPREGIVLVRAGPGGVWSTICDVEWRDSSAQVVCRMLGYTGGAAKYAPFFGHLSQRYSRLAPVHCQGDESTLSYCRGWKDRRTNKCPMGADAAVECFAQNSDVRHVFGYPAVERKHLDIQEGSRVIIPHPHQSLPWTSGTIRQWAFYAATDVTNTSSVSLQIWRRLDDKQYLFVGEVAVGKLTRGFHVRDLTGNDDRLHFEAGDVLGIKFDGVNPIPYDIHPGPCEAEESLDILELKTNLMPGQPYNFENTPSTDEGCKMYSMFVSYVGSERFGSHIFSIGHSLYKVILFSSMSWEDADAACTDELGDRSSVVNINTEAEYSSIVGMLNSMDITDDLWIGSLAARDGGQAYRKWAQCHPRKGDRCTYLGRATVDEYYSYSSDVFYMFTDSCETRRHFICEKTPYSVVIHGDVMTSHLSNDPIDPSPGLSYHNVTMAQSKKPNIISHKVNNRGAPSILVAPVTTAVLLFTCLAAFIIFHLYRRQRRKHSREDEVSESTVRFISLYDKAAQSSLDC